MIPDFNIICSKKAFLIQSNTDDLTIRLEPQKTNAKSGLNIEGKFFKVSCEGSSKLTETIKNNLQALSPDNKLELKTLYAAILNTDEKELDSDKLFKAFGPIQTVYKRRFYMGAEKGYFSGEDLGEESISLDGRNSLDRIKKALCKESALSDKVNEHQRHCYRYLKGKTGILDQITHFCIEEKLKVAKKELVKTNVEITKELKKLHDITPLNSLEHLLDHQDRLQGMLLHAVATEDVVIIDDVLKLGAKPSLIHIFNALLVNSPKLMEKLYKLNKELDLNQVDDRGYNLLHYACCLRNHPMKSIQWLLEHGVKVNAQETFMAWTPLHLGIWRDSIDLESVELLLKYSPNIQDKDGHTALYHALLHQGINPNMKLLELLLKVVNPNVQDKQGQTALHHACGIYNAAFLPTFIALMDAGADGNIKDDSQRSALHLLAQRASYGQEDVKDLYKIMALLIEKGGKVNQKSWGERTVLHHALIGFCYEGRSNKKVLELLIPLMDDINAQDKDGNTYLHYAVESQNIDAVKLLLKAGAKKNIRNKKGLFPIGNSSNVIYDKRSRKIVDLLSG